MGIEQRIGQRFLPNGEPATLVYNEKTLRIPRVPVNPRTVRVWRDYPTDEPVEISVLVKGVKYIQIGICPPAQAEEFIKNQLDKDAQLFPCIIIEYLSAGVTHLCIGRAVDVSTGSRRTIKGMVGVWGPSETLEKLNQ